MDYAKEEIEEYWTKIRKYINTIPNILIKIWCADNNGQIAQSETCNLIGKWAIGQTNENGNGENYYEPWKKAI